MKSDAYFFGRNKLVHQLYDKYRQGQNGGLFGLRKIGKTYEEAFQYIKSPYNLERAYRWKGLLEELGSAKKLIKYLQKTDEFTPTEKSFKIWMEKLLTPRGYQKWLKFNTNLIIERESNQIQQFPQQLRILLCKKIYEMLLKYEYKNSKEIMQILEVKINKSNLLKRLSFLLNNKKSIAKIKKMINTSPVELDLIKLLILYRVEKGIIIIAAEIIHAK